MDDDEQTVYTADGAQYPGVYHVRKDCKMGPEDPDTISKAEAEEKGRRVCSRCGYDDMPALEDHDDREFMRQQGLGGSLGDGQATLDGGIRPRDRGQVSIWPPFAGLLLGALFVLVAISMGAL